MLAGVGVGMLRGVGGPLLDFLDLEICQYSTIVKFVFFGNKLGGADRFGPTQNSKLFIKKSIVFKHIIDLVGVAYV